MNKVVIYARVSTSHHEQNPDIQVQELKSFCLSRGWTITQTIIDYASGGSDKREGLVKLKQLVEAGQVDCIIVTKLDRLFRSLRQLVTALDDFHSRGIAFVAVKDHIDYTTPSGRLFTQLLGSVSEFEKALVRERTLAGLKYARDVKGKTLGRPRKKRNLELINHLAKQGLSTRAIALLTDCSPSTVSREIRIGSKRSVS